jgi:hypothetical protein
MRRPKLMNGWTLEMQHKLHHHYMNEYAFMRRIEKVENTMARRVA